MVLASGAVGQRQSSVFHRCCARAQWSLAAVGSWLFQVALAWIPADQPLDVLGYATLARTSGKGVNPADS